MAKGSCLAMSALAGLASTEDFKRVALKKSASTAAASENSTSLLQIKGMFQIFTFLYQICIDHYINIILLLTYIIMYWSQTLFFGASLFYLKISIHFKCKHLVMCEY